MPVPVLSFSNTEEFEELKLFCIPTHYNLNNKNKI